MRKLKNKVLLCIIFLGILAAQVFVYAHQPAAPLKGIHLVIDSGHGGLDKGASVNGVEEAPLNLMIGKRLKNVLESYGATVQLTRHNEFDLASSSAVNRKRDDMKKRIAIMNSEINDFFISIHMNKYSTPIPKGAQVFYNPVHTMNERLALTIQQSLNEVTKENKNIKKGDFMLLNEAKVPGVLVECGFLSNEFDRQRLQDSQYQGQIVEGIVNGIIQMVKSLHLI